MIRVSNWYKCTTKDLKKYFAVSRWRINMIEKIIAVHRGYGECHIYDIGQAKVMFTLMERYYTDEDIRNLDTFTHKSCPCSSTG